MKRSDRRTGFIKNTICIELALCGPFNIQYNSSYMQQSIYDKCLYKGGIKLNFNVFTDKF